VSHILFGFVESLKTFRLTEMLKNTPPPKKKKHYVFPIRELIKFYSPHWKVPKWEWKWKNPPKIKNMWSYVSNWQYYWVRRRLRWTEQFWLPSV